MAGQESGSATAMLADRLRGAMDAIPILARRVLLETPGVRATVPMLRSVWGAALHDLDRDAYVAVFAPTEDPTGQPDHHGHPRVPGYVLRPAPPDPQFAPAVEWILIGSAVRFDSILRRAWDIASGMGLGRQRRRFHLRRIVHLGPDGRPWSMPVWPLSRAAWPDGMAPSAPCRLTFPAPLRLRRHGRLIHRPTLTDLVDAALGRVRAFLPEDQHAAWDTIACEALDQARSIPAGPWQGRRLDFHRYSATQRAELDLWAVAGSLEMPAGPGPLEPLLAAAQWLHLGKSTVMGLGQLVVKPC